MRRWVWISPLALLLAVAIGDTVVWYMAVQRMQDGLANWVAARRAGGWTVAATTPEAGGWPVAATITLRDFELRGGAADIPQGLSWGADRLELRLALHSPHLLRIEPAGIQHLRFSTAPNIAYAATRLQLLLPLRSSASEQPLELRGEGIRAHYPVGDNEDNVTLDRLDLHAVLHSVAGRGQPAISVTAVADGITLPKHADWALGRHVGSLAVDAALDGPLSNAHVLTERAADWRDGGGTLQVQRIATHWGPLELDGKGTFTLDADLQPSGSGTAEVTGYTTTLDDLAQHGVLPKSAATAAKAVLSLLAVTPPNGGPAQVEVPLSLQHETLSMHQIPLLRLQQLDWPPS